MPLVRISVVDGASSRFKTQISDAIHGALVDTFNVPPENRFHTISVHAQDELVFSPACLGIVHSRSIVWIQIFAREGRTVDMKKALYARIADNIASTTEIGKNDVMINVIDVPKENWSFGNGVAQFA